MPLFGAHMSVAGGLPRAVERAVLHRCESLQVFAKNASQWRGRTLPPEEISEFRDRVEAARLQAVVSHASYLINLAAAASPLKDQSHEAILDELDRAEALGLLGVVLHPGASTTGRPSEAITRVATTLLRVLDSRRHGQTMILLESTAGQGTCLGARFEELADILDQTDGHPRIGVCLDTCHLLAAGYDIATADGYSHTFDEFGRTVGFDRLRCVHVNDSKKPVGSRIDRHEHIGEGCVGLEGFRRLVNDERLSRLPMILETPKAQSRKSGGGPVAVDALDDRNLETLRGLLTALRP